MSFLFGSKPKTKQLPAISGEQSNFLNQLLAQLSGMGAQGFGQGMDYFQNMLSGDDSAFANFEAPFMRQFEEETIPGLTERLTAMGAGGGRSSGAAQAFGKAGQGLQEKLAALRSGLQGQAAQQLMSSYFQGANLGLGTKPFGYTSQPGTPGLAGYAAQGLGQGLGGGGVSGIASLLAGLL